VCPRKRFVHGCVFGTKVQTNKISRIIKIKDPGDKVRKPRAKIQNPIDFRTHKLFWAEVRLCSGVQ
jgi:hypothetical protein